MAVRIGELLLKEKLITPDQLQQALNHQKASGGKLGYNLVKMGFVKDEQVTALLSKQYGVPSISLTQFKIDAADRQARFRPRPRASTRSSRSAATAATLTIAMTDPTNVFAMDDIKFMTGYNVEPVVRQRSRSATRSRRYYPTAKARRHQASGASRVRATGSTLEMASRGLEELQATLGAGADDVEVLEELQEISAEALAQAGRRRAGRPPGERRADVGDSEGRQRHPHRAVREGAARPVPHRRDSLQHHERRR